MSEVRDLIAADPALSRNLALARSITGFGGVSAIILLAELPNIAEFTPKHSPPSSACPPGLFNAAGSAVLGRSCHTCGVKCGG